MFINYSLQNKKWRDAHSWLEMRSEKWGMGRAWFNVRFLSFETAFHKKIESFFTSFSVFGSLIRREMLGRRVGDPSKHVAKSASSESVDLDPADVSDNEITTNQIFNRFMFHQRSQRPTETLDNFVRSLKKLILGLHCINLNELFRG